MQVGKRRGTLRVMLFRTFAFAALASAVACVPPVQYNDAPDTAPIDAQAEAASEAGADTATAPHDAGADVQVDANEAGAAPIVMLLAAAAGPSAPGDPTIPFESDSVSVTRSSATSKLLLSSSQDGLGPLYVDDNVHLVVAPTTGAKADRYFEFWSGYPCPAASTTLPPGGDGSGHSPPIDVSSLFSADTTGPQKVTLEFWHCATHTPAPHSAFYLVEK